MNYFHKTSHLSQILEESDKHAVILFKYSSECGSSSRLKEEFEKNISEKKLTAPMYLVTVQIEKALSEKIEKYFQIKHESPQILIINKGKLVYTAHHRGIKTEDFVLE